MDDNLNNKYDKYVSDGFNKFYKNAGKSMDNIYNGIVGNTYAHSRVNLADKTGFGVEIVLRPLIDESMSDEAALIFMKEHQVQMPARYKSLEKSFSGEKEAVQAVIDIVNVNHETVGDTAEKPASSNLYDHRNGGITVIYDKDGVAVGRLALDRQKEKYLMNENIKDKGHPGASSSATSRLQMLYSQIDVPEETNEPDYEPGF